MVGNDYRTDEMEAVIAEALDAAGVAYRRDNPLDFECEGFAIECKRFYTDRIRSQIINRDNAILIQGIGAARAFAKLIRPRAVRAAASVRSGG